VRIVVPSARPQRGVWVSAAALFLLLLLAAGGARAGDVVFVPASADDAVAETQVQVATQFYGLNLKVMRLQTPSDVQSVLSALRSSDTLSAVIAADALPSFDRHELLAALHHSKTGNVPLLILGINRQTDPRQLEAWSSGSLLQCSPLPAGASANSYAFGPDKHVTRELANEEIPASLAPACMFLVEHGRGMDTLMSVRWVTGEGAIFARTRSDAEEVFFLAAMKPADLPPKRNMVETFSRMAPVMMFVRAAAGERAWHSFGHYANLTIDDAWLTQSYGRLEYEALLGEMEKHNFHTTLAFVPWNYDRSRQNVISLFLAHGDRYSISIHGDDHAHQEFGDYDSAPLAAQVVALKQAIARMEKFKSLTGIPYDRVMVFPHGVAPEATFAAMKQYGYLLTTNSDNVPLGAERPSDFLFYLRPQTLRYSNFSSVLRYSAEIPLPRAILAVAAFLENPILLYGHEKLFAPGIGTFNGVADTVNAIQPDTRWRSLGEIAQHLYLLRLREDQNFDVHMYSSQARLENHSASDHLFFVRREETFRPEIKALTVDGQPHSFGRSGEHLTFSLAVPAGQSRLVEIDYENDFRLETTDISKDSLYVAALRRAADFRDMTLSRHPWGRAITDFYYSGNIDEL